MSKLRMIALGVVVTIAQGSPALAQCGGGPCTGGVPGPELGAGVLGMACTIGLYRLIRRRSSKQ